MRVRALIVLGLASLTTAGLVITACGGEEETPPGSSPEDGGSDSGPGPGADSGGDGDAKVPTEDCDKSKDFLDDVPDASLANGASSSGECVACLRASCKATLDLCNVDCECREFVGETIGCVAEGTAAFTECATAAMMNGLPSAEVQGIGLSIYQCATTNCNEACALSDLIPGDAGSGDAGSDDAGSDDAGDDDAGDASTN